MQVFENIGVFRVPGYVILGGTTPVHPGTPYLWLAMGCFLGLGWRMDDEEVVT